MHISVEMDANQPYQFTQLPNTQRVCAQKNIFPYKQRSYQNTKPQQVDDPKDIVWFVSEPLQLQGVSFDYCAFRGQQMENVQMMEFDPYDPSSNMDSSSDRAEKLGECRYLMGDPAKGLYKDDTDGTCNTYLFNRQLPDAFMKSGPPTPPMDILQPFSRNQTLYPSAKRTFQIDENDKDKDLQVCKKACVSSVTSKCSHFYVKDGVCNLLYGATTDGPSDPNQQTGDLYDFTSSIGARDQSALCKNGEAIDDYYQCQNAVKSINRFVNQEYFKEKDKPQYKITWEGQTDNSAVPYGCIVQYNYWNDRNKTGPAYQMYFNTNKSNKSHKNANYYKVCTAQPRNKVAMGRLNNPECPFGSRIFDQEACKRVSNAMYFTGDGASITNNSLPAGCIALVDKSSGNDLIGKTSVKFNNVPKNLPAGQQYSSKFTNFAPICDLYPDIKSGAFQPVLATTNKDGRFWDALPAETGRVLPHFYVDRAQELRNKNIKSEAPFLFANASATTCLNKQSFIRRKNIVGSVIPGLTAQLSNIDPWDCLKECEQEPGCKSFAFTRAINIDERQVTGFCDLYRTSCEGSNALTSEQLKKVGFTGSMPKDASDKCPSKRLDDPGATSGQSKNVDCAYQNLDYFAQKSRYSCYRGNYNPNPISNPNTKLGVVPNCSSDVINNTSNQFKVFSSDRVNGFDKPTPFTLLNITTAKPYLRVNMNSPKPSANDPGTKQTETKPEKKPENNDKDLIEVSG